MKKVLVLLIVAIILSVTACVPNTTPDIPQPTAAPTPSPTLEPQPTPMPEPAMAICMGVYDHPIHRLVQLGFLDRCEELGYTDISIIGHETGDQQALFDAAEVWAESIGNKPAAILLWNGDHNSDKLVKELGEKGIYVGVPHFTISVDDIPYGEEGFELPEGYTFQYAIDYYKAGQDVMDHMAPYLDGKTGTVLTSTNIINADNYQIKGFFDRFDELNREGKYDLSGITVINNFLEGGEVEGAIEIVAQKLKEYPDILAAFGSAGVSGQSWPAALKAAGYKPGDVMLATMDVNEENIASFEESWVNYIIQQPLYDEGYQCANYFHKLFMGEEVPIYGYVEPKYITTENAETAVPEFKSLYACTADDEYFEKFKKYYNE